MQRPGASVYVLPAGLGGTGGPAGFCVAVDMGRALKKPPRKVSHGEDQARGEKRLYGVGKDRERAVRAADRGRRGKSHSPGLDVLF
jgi:hypothetical protein